MLSPMLWLVVPIIILIAVGPEGRRKMNRWAFRALMLVALIDLARWLTIGSGQRLGVFLLAASITAGVWFLMERYSVSSNAIDKRINEQRKRLGYVTPAPESQH